MRYGTSALGMTCLCTSTSRTDLSQHPIMSGSPGLEFYAAYPGALLNASDELTTHDDRWRFEGEVHK